jgi:hypothetical protein
VPEPACRGLASGACHLLFAIILSCALIRTIGPNGAISAAECRWIAEAAVAFGRLSVQPGCVKGLLSTT